MTLSIVAALDPKRVIGINNSLPWNIPQETKHFVDLTKNSTVIMGEKTFQSIDYKPLPNRRNIIISKNLPQSVGIEICRSFQEGIKRAKTYPEKINIIGGGTIYQQALPLTDIMHLSHIKDNYEGDIYFPDFKKKEWKVIETKEFKEFTLKTYKRKK